MGAWRRWLRLLAAGLMHQPMVEGEHPATALAVLSRPGERGRTAASTRPSCPRAPRGRGRSRSTTRGDRRRSCRRPPSKRAARRARRDALAAPRHPPPLRGPATEAGALGPSVPGADLTQTAGAAARRPAGASAPRLGCPGDERRRGPSTTARAGHAAPVRGR